MSSMLGAPGPQGPPGPPGPPGLPAESSQSSRRVGSGAVVFETLDQLLHVRIFIFLLNNNLSKPKFLSFPF